MHILFFIVFIWCIAIYLLTFVITIPLIGPKLITASALDSVMASPKVKVGDQIL